MFITLTLFTMKVSAKVVVLLQTSVFSHSFDVLFLAVLRDFR